MTGRLALRFLIAGTVQGVGYRYFAQRAADELGIVGYVRNRPDGRVEVVAVGTGDGLAQFETILRNGPPLGQVDYVESSEISVDMDRLKSFDIKR